MIFLSYKILHGADAEEQSRAGREMLCGLVKRIGISPDGINIIKDENGRPRISGMDDIDFNISHSPFLAVCVLSVGEGRVGADTEPIMPTVPKERRERFVKRYFSENESAELAVAPDSFSKIWTRKEAMLKRNGKGLAGISEADTCLPPDDVRFETFEINGSFVTVCIPAHAEIIIFEE